MSHNNRFWKSHAQNKCPHKPKKFQRFTINNKLQLYNYSSKVITFIFHKSNHMVNQAIFFQLSLKLQNHSNASSFMHFKQRHSSMPRCPSLIQIDNHQCKHVHPTHGHLEIKITRNHSYKFQMWQHMQLCDYHRNNLFHKP